jgi:hypothetical protein
MRTDSRVTLERDVVRPSGRWRCGEPVPIRQAATGCGRTRKRVGCPPHPLARRSSDCPGSPCYSPIVLFVSSMVAEDTGALDVSSSQFSKAVELDELKSMCTRPFPA